MAAKKGFFFTGRRKRQKTNYICSLHATAVGLTVEVGWGARGMALSVQVQKVGISMEWLFLFLIGAVFGNNCWF
jgi:biotin transporter BioY